VARPDLKRLLQSVAVRTQFPPFVWLYRALYALAVRLCVRRLGRIRGVRSIYLRRGLASRRAVYGLSDIDLLVMVEKDAQGSAAARVRRQYALLRRLIPMLPDKEELALYDAEQFRLLYERSPFYRYRFDRGRRDWRRLRGDDVFELLPPYVDQERELAVQELRPAWHYLAQELLPDDARPAFVRRYVAQKWMGEAARVALLSAGRQAPGRPEAAVAEAAALYPQIAGKLEAFRLPFNRRSAPGSVSADDLLSSYVYLARAAFSVRPVQVSAVRKLRVERAPREAVELLLPGGALATVERACAALPGIERAVLVPRLCFEEIGTLDMEPGEFAGASVDAFDLVLVGRQLPPAEALRELNRALEPFRPAVNAFFCDGALALSLRPGRGLTVKDAAGAPEFFACLSSAEPLEGILQMAGAAEADRWFERGDSLAFRARSILDRLDGGDAFRLPMRSFLTLFYEAGRAALLAAQPAGSVVRVPVSSGQLVDALAELTPWAGDVLRRIHAEYRREVRGEPSEAVRYTRWMAAYAGSLRGLVGSPAAAAEVKGPARMELTISVVIVTRNRAAMLRRALESLVAQRRPPDQVVVVDNASTDGTLSVALSFADTCNLELVREETVGISYARNTGVARSTGDVVAFLDDDCEAAPGWLAALEVPFLKDPNVGAVGGVLAPFEERRGLIARFFDGRLDAALAGGSARER
jgi:predicted nucleotidyltransferase